MDRHLIEIADELPTREPINPIRASWNEHGVHRYADSDTRRYWREVKRHGVRKTKTLHSHRAGR